MLPSGSCLAGISPVLVKTKLGKRASNVASIAVRATNCGSHPVVLTLVNHSLRTFASVFDFIFLVFVFVVC